MNNLLCICFIFPGATKLYIPRHRTLVMCRQALAILGTFSIRSKSLKDRQHFLKLKLPMIYNSTSAFTGPEDEEPLQRNHGNHNLNLEFINVANLGVTAVKMPRCVDHCTLIQKQQFVKETVFTHKVTSEERSGLSASQFKILFPML